MPVPDDTRPNMSRRRPLIRESNQSLIGVAIFFLLLLLGHCLAKLLGLCRILVIILSGDLSRILVIILFSATAWQNSSAIILSGDLSRILVIILAEGLSLRATTFVCVCTQRCKNVFSPSRANNVFASGKARAKATATTITTTHCQIWMPSRPRDEQIIVIIEEPMINRLSDGLPLRLPVNDSAASGARICGTRLGFFSWHNARARRKRRLRIKGQKLRVRDGHDCACRLGGVKVERHRQNQ